MSVDQPNNDVNAFARPQLCLGRLGASPCQLILAVEDVISGELCEVCGAITIDWYNRLPPSSSRFFSGRLSERTGPFPGVMAGLKSLCHDKTLHDDVLRVVVLVDADGLLLVMTGNVHVQLSRHVAHVRHLKTLRKLCIDLSEQLLVPT